MVAISLCLLITISDHHVHADFADKLKAMVQRPSRHLEKVPRSQSLIPERVKRASPDYQDYDNEEYDSEKCPIGIQYELEDIFQRSYTGPGKAFLEFLFSLKSQICNILLCCYSNMRDWVIAVFPNARVMT